MPVISNAQVRGFRLQNHHLAQSQPISALSTIVGACGLQNTPPYAWLTASHNRLPAITRTQLTQALESNKLLLQAWSYRGAPVIFPTEQASIFLTALIPEADEQPWIYTRGLLPTLPELGLTFEQALHYVINACHQLQQQTIVSKARLDQLLAALITPELPATIKAKWLSASPYSNQQTLGAAVVSFLLRPCAHLGLIVFGQRRGNTPTFTTPENWLKQSLIVNNTAQQQLVRKFVHCYGPTTRHALQRWLGCGAQQAKRLWQAIAPELQRVTTAGQTRYILATDYEQLTNSEPTERLLLLGAHDPYLDLADRETILAPPTLQRQVWRYSGNPGVITCGGRIIGIWRSQRSGNKLTLNLKSWSTLSAANKSQLEELANADATFNQQQLVKLVFEH